MSTSLHTTTPIRMLRHSLLVGLTLACLLLSGCAIWPKSLTFWGNDEPETPPVASPVATAAGGTELAKLPPFPPIMEAVTEPVSAPAPADVSPVASLPPAPPMAASDKPPGPVKMERGYYINVGLFAVPSNASNAFMKLEKAGLPVYTELLETNVGKLTRVRVGGFASKAKAAAAAKKIRSLHLDAIVFHHK